MTKRTVEITNPTGLHARPAHDFVKIASSYKCDVYIEKDSKKVNAKSILGLLSLGLKKGTKMDIITDGDDEQAALENLVDFITNLTE